MYEQIGNRFAEESGSRDGGVCIKTWNEESNPALRDYVR